MTLCKIRRLLLFVIYVSSVCFLGNVDANDSCSKIEIAVVDVQLVLERSLAVQNIKKSIANLTASIQKDISEKEAKLKSVEESIKNKRNVITTDEFEKETNEFQKSVNNLQKDVQDKKIRLERSHAEAFDRVHDVLIAIILELSNKHDFSVAIPSSHILFAKKNLDITDEVLSLLNERVQDIQLNYDYSK
ncbi:MAG: OmpH family outer membrane protein [Rickettsiaceae bacterium]